MRFWYDWAVKNAKRFGGRGGMNAVRVLGYCRDRDRADCDCGWGGKQRLFLLAGTA